MAANLLTPSTGSPNGVPPKNIIAFLGLGLLVVIGLGAIYWDMKGSKSSDEKAKATLQEATSVKDAGVAGDPKDIVDAANKAGIPAALRGPEVQAAAPPKPMPGDDLPPFPVGSTGGPVPSPSTSTIDAVRETEIANAKPVVFDVSLSPLSEASTKQDNPIARLIEQERVAQEARAQASGKAGDLSQLSGILAASQAQSQPPISGRGADSAWLKEYSSSRRSQGIRPSLPEAALMLTQGSVIEAVSLSEINSDLPGIIRARTTRDIYDSTTQRNLVLPRGSLAIGEYSSQVRMGQERLLFAFTRLVLPNGQSYDLNAFNGSDSAGRAGLKGDVDNHYFRLFGTSLMIGLLADRVVQTRAVPQGTNGQAGGLSATGQILTDSAKSILERNREVAPTLSIPSGARLVIEVKRDMIFPSAYRE